ncbi:Pr6Pr family membrane protein [Rhabdaerophilum sp. SD176]|uniref:Pr6Pr family membrane protein n=1 Tax=Rhabdaerophilum sp. SD176 TaxID=2983548 RepID=UPI0024DFDACA|nr:Pr6Pr family membrane protein [Rhabdaerophilum sp. SD176]
MSAERGLAGFIAAIALLSLAGQGHMLLGLVAAKGGHAGHALWVFLGFYTILTNLLVTACCLARLIGPWPAFWPEPGRALAGLALQIGLVGLVYHLLLSDLWAPAGLHFWADQGVHTAVPLLFVAYWALFAPKAALVWRDSLRWLLYPAGYFVYALVRGAADGWYPYPFLDVGRLGYGPVLANGLGIAVILFAAGLGMVAVSRVLPAGQR